MISINLILMAIGISFLFKFRDKYPIMERSPLLSIVCILGILVNQESCYILMILDLNEW
jgi:hypothetical protein